jgi:NADP-dependent aldehyde dehydrogenase
MQPPSVLIAGQWRPAASSGTFHAFDPSTAAALPTEFPISAWSDCDEALSAAADAASKPIAPDVLADFLNRYAARIELRASEIVDTAHQETALPKSPRLADVELPRTTNQLRQAAAAALDGSWAIPTIDAKLNIRSRLAPVGPVLIMGPNNFPLAFNAISGGDFAAAIAAGNPVIAKSHPSHPATTRLLAEEAFATATDAGLPPGFIQLLYHLSAADGLRMAADARLGAMAFTGSRPAGLALKAAADAVGKPIYLEMSSINPVVILPGALRERMAKITDEFADSALAASGQFCTSPGLVLTLFCRESMLFMAEVKRRYESLARPPGYLLSESVARSLATGVEALQAAGAKLMTGGLALPKPGWRYANTLLTVGADKFLADPHRLQTETFGNAALWVDARDVSEAAQVLSSLEGNLTGSIYSDTAGSDDSAYDILSPILRRRVGRLLNDKMPTGVAVTAAMDHGGPYPATCHPGFTSVGIPASLRRFARLECYDNVRASRLPTSLADK